MPRRRRFGPSPSPQMAVSSGVRVINYASPLAGVFPQAQSLAIAPSPPGATIKAAIFTGVFHSGLSNTVTSTGDLSLGFCDSALTQRVVYAFGEDATAAASADTAYRIDNSTVVQMSGVSGGALACEGNITSLDTDGVTLSWSHLLDVEGQAILFYGDDVQSAVREVTGSASIGGTVSITGLPFAPDVVFVGSCNQAFTTDGQGGEAMMSFGFAARTSATNACSCITWEDNQANTSSGCITRDDACAVRLTSAAGTITEGARLAVSSWNSDGVTFTTANEASALRVMVLCLKLPGTVAWAGAPTLDSDVVASFSRTDPQFKPQALVFSGTTSATVNTVGVTRGGLCIAATTGSETGEVSAVFRDNQATSDSGVTTSQTRSFALITVPNSSSMDWVATVTSLDVLGWTMSVSDASSEDRPTAYLAISVIEAIVGNETVGITEGHVFKQNQNRRIAETVGITEGHVFKTMGVGGSFQTLVVNETVGISETYIPKGLIVGGNEVVDIAESLVMFGRAVMVANEAVGISEGFVRYTGRVLVANETVGISEQANFGAGPVPIKRTPRGATLSGGAEMGTTLLAGSERGTVRG